jgi:hypothetical protein
MTSTTTGLPDRYRPLDQVGPDEPTSTGVIRCWRAKDRVLNRDVAIRVHTPAGPAAHEWITRALTAGGLATPALAMVYDASEGVGDPQAPGGAAYVVNEWIDGETLAERLSRGPLPDREVRTVLRRLAEGVAEAHRVGLAVGGLTPENVVLRPNGLVGLRGVPAATGTVDGDIAALGHLLEACLTGGTAGDAPPVTTEALNGPSDLVALARRARSSEPGQGLSSVAAMATLLAARPPAGPDRARGGSTAASRNEDTDNGWLNRLKERRSADSGPAADRSVAPSAADPGDPVRMDPETLPPVPAVRPLTAGASPVVVGADTIDAGTVPPTAGAYAGSPYAAAGGAPIPPAPISSAPGAAEETYRAVPYTDPGYDDEPFAVLGADRVSDTSERGYGDTRETEVPRARRRLVVVGLPLLAIAVVVALAYWIGSSVLSVAGSVDDVEGSTPSAGTSAENSDEPAAPSAGAAIPISAGSVYDPFGDGDPDHPEDVPLSHDGDPATDWATYRYLGGADFGGLKPGVGVVYDLGSEQSLASVTIATTLPGSTVEIRTGDAPDGDIDSFSVAAKGTIQGSTDLTFDEAVTTRYVLVWITGLVPVEDGAQADLAEVTIHAAG